jgi:hypothetical protein
MSTEARERIRQAQIKRWAAVRQPAKPDGTAPAAASPKMKKSRLNRRLTDDEKTGSPIETLRSSRLLSIIDVAARGDTTGPSELRIYFARIACPE